MSGTMRGPDGNEVGRRRRPRDTRVPIWFGPVFGFFGVVALVAGVGIVRDELRLSSDGVSIDAVVERAYVNMGSGDDADTYWIAYSFTTAAGVPVTARSQVDWDAYRRVAPGVPVQVSYLPADPSTSRVGPPEFQPFPALFVVGIGALFTGVGVAITLTAFRRRRLAASATSGEPTAGAPDAPGPSPLPLPNSPGTYQFTRSPMRVLADLLLAPLGAVLFLGAAVFMLGQVGTNPSFALFGLVFGFFGLLMASGASVTIRRGARSRILEIDRDGIWTPELGRLPWTGVREVRIEKMTGPSGTRRRSTAYDRLGIFPRDAMLAATAPGGFARRLTGAFFGLARLLRPEAKVPDLSAMAPFGVAAYELEQPLESVWPLVARYVPVFGVDGQLLGGPANLDAPAAEPAGPAEPAAILGTLLGSSGAPFMRGPASPAAQPDPVPARPSIFSPLPGAGTAFVRVVAAAGPTPTAARFRRRERAAPGAYGDLFRALGFVVMPALIALVFGGVGISTPGGGVAAVLFAVFPLAIASIFVLIGLSSLFGALERVRVATGDEEVLTVDEDGISMSGMGRLSWAEIAEARIGQADVVQDGEGAGPDRPRLEIVPRAASRLESRPRAARALDAFREWRRRRMFWRVYSPEPGAFALDLDLLDADPNEIIDLIARYRVVDEE